MGRVLTSLNSLFRLYNMIFREAISSNQLWAVLFTVSQSILTFDFWLRQIKKTSRDNQSTLSFELYLITLPKQKSLLNLKMTISYHFFLKYKHTGLVFGPEFYANLLKRIFYFWKLLMNLAIDYMYYEVFIIYFFQLRDRLYANLVLIHFFLINIPFLNTKQKTPNL